MRMKLLLNPFLYNGKPDRLPVFLSPSERNIKEAVTLFFVSVFSSVLKNAPYPPVCLVFLLSAASLSFVRWVPFKNSALDKER